MRETINLKRVVLTSQARKTLETFKQINNKLYIDFKTGEIIILFIALKP